MIRRIWALVKDSASNWSEHQVPSLGAALAYYTIFSLVPLLMVVVGMAGFFFGQEAARSQILSEVSGLLGEKSGAIVQDMMQSAQQPKTGLIGTLIGIVTLLVGASGTFAELQRALNIICEVQPKPGRGMLGLIRDRFLSFATVVGTGFLLLVSLVLSAALAAIGKELPGFLPAPESVLHGLNFLLSFVVITGLFAMLFKLLPDVKIRWGDVWIGAAATALLFDIGKFLIGFYLGKSNIASVFGAAGSLVILLVWIYYSAQIFLFGAEFTVAYANRYGSKIKPTEQAVAVGVAKDRQRNSRAA